MAAIVGNYISDPSASAVTAVQPSIDALGAVVTAQGNSITAQGNSITSLNNSVSSINGTLTTQGNSITSINNSLSTINSTLSTISNTLQTVTYSLATQQSEIASVRFTVSPTSFPALTAVTPTVTVNSEDPNSTTNNAVAVVTSGKFVVTLSGLTAVTLQFVLDALTTTIQSRVRLYDSSDVLKTTYSFSKSNSSTFARTEQFFVGAGDKLDVSLQADSVGGTQPLELYSFNGSYANSGSNGRTMALTYDTFSFANVGGINAVTWSSLPTSGSKGMSPAEMYKTNATGFSYTGWYYPISSGGIWSEYMNAVLYFDDGVGNIRVPGPAQGIGPSNLGSTLPRNQWHHICFVITSTYVSYYINNVRTDYAHAQGTVGTVYYNGQSTLLGQFEIGPFGNLSSAAVSNVAYYDYALSDADVTTLYGGGTPSLPALGATPVSILGGTFIGHIMQSR